MGGHKRGHNSWLGYRHTRAVSQRRLSTCFKRYDTQKRTRQTNASGSDHINIPLFAKEHKIGTQANPSVFWRLRLVAQILPFMMTGRIDIGLLWTKRFTSFLKSPTTDRQAKANQSTHVLKTFAPSPPFKLISLHKRLYSFGTPMCRDLNCKTDQTLPLGKMSFDKLFSPSYVPSEFAAIYLILSDATLVIESLESL